MGSSPRSRDDSLLRRLRRRKLGHVRAGGADALVAFVAEGEVSPPPVLARIRAGTEMRWYPIEGGHLVKWPWQGSAPDTKHFRVEPGGWDHEHCSACNATIEVDEGCWVTERGSFFVVCEACRRRIRRLGKG